MSTPKLIEVANIFHVEEGLTNGNLDHAKLIDRSLFDILVEFTKNVVHAGVDIAASNLFGVIKHPKDIFSHCLVKLRYVF